MRRKHKLSVRFRTGLGMRARNFVYRRRESCESIFRSISGPKSAAHSFGLRSVHDAICRGGFDTSARDRTPTGDLWPWDARGADRPPIDRKIPAERALSDPPASTRFSQCRGWSGSPGTSVSSAIARSELGVNPRDSGTAGLCPRLATHFLNSIESLKPPCLSRPEPD